MIASRIRMRDNIASLMNKEFLNKHRIRTGHFASSDTEGFNGAFTLAFEGESRRVFCIASNGMGWEHVSVSFGQNKSAPSWDLMCKVKALFWNDEDYVMQIHPPKSEWISNHPGCLHLWRPTDPNVHIPKPPGIMVGVQSLGEVK